MGAIGHMGLRAGEAMFQRSAEEIVYRYAVRSPYTGDVTIKRAEWRLVKVSPDVHRWEKVT